MSLALGLGVLGEILTPKWKVERRINREGSRRRSKEILSALPIDGVSQGQMVVATC